MKKELLLLLENVKYKERYGVYYLPDSREFVCWGVGNQDFNKGNTFWGHYFHNETMAVKDCIKRVGENHITIKDNRESFNKKINNL